MQTIKDILIRNGIRHGIRPGDSLYFGPDSEVRVEADRFVRGFEIARAVRRQKLDARVPAWSNEWAEGLRRGTPATELSGAWLVGQLSSWVAPQTSGLARGHPGELWRHLLRVAAACRDGPQGAGLALHPAHHAGRRSPIGRVHVIRRLSGVARHP